MILREDIAMVLEDAYWLGNDAARGRREDDSSMLIARGYTDRIMALIAEALLSDQAVDELVTLVAQGSRNPIAMMNARATVKSIIARLLASPTGKEAGE